MPSTFARRWEQTRAGGALRFIAFQGVFRWAGFMFLLWSTVTATLYLGHVRDFALFPTLVTGAVVCVCGGFFWGILTWSLNEWLYERRTRGLHKSHRII